GSSRTIRSSGSIPPSFWQGTLDVSAWPLPRRNAVPERATGGTGSGPPERELGRRQVHVHVGRRTRAERVLPYHVLARATGVVRTVERGRPPRVVDLQRRLERPHKRFRGDCRTVGHTGPPRARASAARGG